MTNAGRFVVERVQALSFSSPKDRERSFLLFLTESTVWVSSCEKMITRPVSTDFGSFRSLWQRPVRFMRIASVSNFISRMTRNLDPNFATARCTVAAPIPSILACSRMDINGLLRMALRKLFWYKTPFGPLPARLLIHSSLSMRFLASWPRRTLGKTSQSPLQCHSLCALDEEVQKPALVYLAAKTLWSTQQCKDFFL